MDESMKLDSTQTISTNVPSKNSSDSNESKAEEQWDSIEPSNALEWQKMFKFAVQKSKNYEITYEQHLGCWMKLCHTVHLTPNPAESFLDCCMQAICTMPIAADDNSTTWTTFIELVYQKILNEELKYEDAESAFKLAEKKFSNSYFRVSQYWNTVRSYERKLMKKNDLQKEDYINKFIELYTKQFSKPYYNMDEDWERFKIWAKEEKLSNNVKVEVQSIFLSNANESRRISETYTDILNENVLLHPVNFDDWITSLLTKTPPALDTVEVLCEEMICKQPNVICFYYVYINALNSDQFCVLDRKEKLLNVIKRGIHYGRIGLENMTQFIEYSLIAASRHLKLDDVLKLVDDIIKVFPLSSSLNIWYASRRAVIIAARNLAHCGHLAVSELKNIFKQALLPFTFDFYLTNSIPEECVGLDSYESKMIELLKLWVLCERFLRKLSWKETLALWEGNFGPLNTNPVVLVEYAKFITLYGTHDEAEAAYQSVLTRLQTINESSSSTYMSQKCQLQILSNVLELKLIHGTASDQTSLCYELSRKQSQFNQSFEDNCDLKYATTMQEMSVDQSPSSEHPVSSWSTNVESLMVTNTPQVTSSDDLPISKKMKMLTVDADEINKPDKKTDCLIFISNLNFKANDSEIREAFKEQGINVVRIKIKRNNQGKSYGYGTLELKTKEEMDRALKTMDRIKILGRETFLSPHREVKKIMKYSKPTPDPLQPTVLFITDLPMDWRNPRRIENALLPYGHIKTVTVEDKIEPVVAKVEYHMSSDADNAYCQWKEGAVFKGLGLKIKKGFMSSKHLKSTNEKTKNGDKSNIKNEKYRLKKEKHVSDEEVKHELKEATIVDTEAKTNKIGPFMPEGVMSPTKTKGALKSFAFIPQQVRKSDQRFAQKRPAKSHMKERLYIPKNDNTSSSPTDVSNGSSPLVKKKKLLLTTEDETVTTESTKQDNTSDMENPVTAQSSSIKEEQNKSEVTKCPLLSNDDFKRMISKKT